jgi:hypothetical protein
MGTAHGETIRAHGDSPRGPTKETAHEETAHKGTIRAHGDSPRGDILSFHVSMYLRTQIEIQTSRDILAVDLERHEGLIKRSFTGSTGDGAPLLVSWE